MRRFGRKFWLKMGLGLSKLNGHSNIYRIDIDIGR